MFDSGDVFMKNQTAALFLKVRLVLQSCEEDISCVTGASLCSSRGPFRKEPLTHDHVE